MTEKKQKNESSLAEKDENEEKNLTIQEWEMLCLISVLKKFEENEPRRLCVDNKSHKYNNQICN